MQHRGSLRRTTGVIAALVVTALLVSVAGPATVFSRARLAEQLRNNIDAVGIVERDIAVEQARHRAYLIGPNSDRRVHYLDARHRRDAHLDSLRASTTVDDSLRQQFRLLQLQLFRLDTVRDTVIGNGAVSLDKLQTLLAFDAAMLAKSTVDTTLRALEGRYRQRLSVAHPQLEALRRLVLTLIPAVLLAVLGSLGWLYRRLLHASESEAAQAMHYREMIDESPDGVMVHSDGRIVYANAQAVELSGATSAAEMVGRDAIELIPPEDRLAIRAREAEAMKLGGRPAPRLTRMNRLDGRIIEVETRVARIDFNGTQSVEVTLRDVAERRTREVALAASEQRFRAVLDSMEEGVVLQDEHMNIVLWNAAAERILGLSSDQLAGRTSYDPAWRATDEFGDELPGERHFTSVAIRTARPAGGTMGLDRGDGSRAWLRVSAVPMLHPSDARPYAVVGTFTDITAQRETARRLAESESRYRLITEHTADLITLRAADDRLLFVSPSHERILGWTSNELTGQLGHSLVHPDDLTLLTGSDDALFSGTGPQSVTLRVRHKDGHWVWLEVVASPIAAGNGSISTFVTAARDITDRRRLEEELRQAQKMESLGRVASAIAHDFNNLLTAIRGSAELLLMDAREGISVTDGVGEITEAVERAAALTAQLLAFARRQHTSAAVLNCAAVLRSAAPILTRLTAPRVRVLVEISAEAEYATIWADRSQFEQVLFNLVVNARDASTPQGQVDVLLGRQDLATERPGRYGMIAAGSYVTLTVTDHGSGMSEDVLAQLFEPFYTTKPQGKGTGLGLSTVYGLVLQHRGGIAVDSAEHSGSTFTIFWPQLGDDVPTSESDSGIQPHTKPRDEYRSDASRPSAGTPVETLLLVDDEPAVRRTVAKLLERGGFRVVQAASGREALDLLASAQIRIDALVTDIRMPGMSGVELVESMDERHIDIPVLFLSGQIDDPIPVNWHSAQPRRFLRKPFQSGELSREVRRLFPAAS